MSDPPAPVVGSRAIHEVGPGRYAGALNRASYTQGCRSAPVRRGPMRPSARGLNVAGDGGPTATTRPAALAEPMGHPRCRRGPTVSFRVGQRCCLQPTPRACWRCWVVLQCIAVGAACGSRLPFRRRFPMPVLGVVAVSVALLVALGGSTPALLAVAMAVYSVAATLIGWMSLATVVGAVGLIEIGAGGRTWPRRK